MLADDLAQLRQAAIDRIIFHATPRSWIEASGPWVLDRGDGALLYDGEGAATVGVYMLGLLEGLRRHDIVGDVRGSGLFMAVELVHDADRGDAAGPILPADNQVARVARRMGLFVRPLGGTIILGPPLIFTKAQAERAVDVLDTALSEVEARAPAEVGR